jgi:hypothetical protein
MSQHKTCEADVSYDAFKGKPYAQCPCFSPRGVGCSLAVYPTAEEIEAEDKMFQEHFERTVKAREAIVDDCGGPWKKGALSASGEIPCPVCGTGQLKYSRAGCNGHIHAACTTENCVAWME